MKRVLFRSTLALALALSLGPSVRAGGRNDDANRNHELAEAEQTVQNFRSDLTPYFAEAYGYAVFPTIGTGAFVFGGSYGTGKVCEHGILVGNAKVSKASFGLQAGGEVYSEIVFFRDRRSFDRFKHGEVTLDAKVSATAATANASLQATWNDGIAVFARTRGGLMAAAAVGGQHLRFRPVRPRVEEIHLSVNR